MKKRLLGQRIRDFAELYPVVTVIGPRQSGKTTLAKMLFPNSQYVNLEALSEREFAQSDPIGFLRRFSGKPVIIDEVQRVPELLSQIQAIVDDDRRPGQFLLTGSQNFSMMRFVSQSLAGRTALCTLLPFSMAEIDGEVKRMSIDEIMWRGFYPKLHDNKKINPTDELSFYVSTYLERDVREIESIRNLRSFSVFLRLAAGRTGQMLNVASLAADVGISPKVARDWLSILEASYVVKMLEPWHTNLNKRMVKAPKLYFLDVGLACHLVGITDPSQLAAHPLRGALFETMIVDEFFKAKANATGHQEINYYRDSNHNEIDLVVKDAGTVSLYEIKSGETFCDDWVKAARRLSGQFGEDVSVGVIYGGSEEQHRSDFTLIPWKRVSLRKGTK